MSVNVTPPSVETCHWTVGAGLPVAAAVNEADCPVMTVTAVGFVPTTGRVSRVNVAADEVAAPAELVNTA